MNKVRHVSLGTIKEKVTCLQDLGLLLCNSGVLAYSALVFRKCSELVGVAHDEVRDGGIQSMVMLQHSEPVLQTHNTHTVKK